MASKQLPDWPFKDGSHGDDALHNYLWEMHQFIKELDERVQLLEARGALGGLF